MVYVRIKEILKEEGKSKYWLIQQMECSYQSLSNLINNETSRIQFITLEKLCKILNRSPGEIFIIK